MNLKEICEHLQYQFCSDQGDIELNEGYIELVKKAKLEEDSCIYDGIANQNGAGIVRAAISCYEGKRIRVCIEEVK